MAAISNKITNLRARISAKQKKLFSNEIQVKAAKSSIKALKEEIAELEAEILNLQIHQLSETLTEKGITTDDIQEAIAAGVFEKSSKEENCATYSTTKTRQEENSNEASGS